MRRDQHQNYLGGRLGAIHASEDKTGWVTLSVKMPFWLDSPDQSGQITCGLWRCRVLPLPRALAKKAVREGWPETIAPLIPVYGGRSSFMIIAHRGKLRWGKVHCRGSDEWVYFADGYEPESAFSFGWKDYRGVVLEMHPRRVSHAE